MVLKSHISAGVYTVYFAWDHLESSENLFLILFVEDKLFYWFGVEQLIPYEDQTPYFNSFTWEKK